MNNTGLSIIYDSKKQVDKFPVPYSIKWKCEGPL